MPLLLLRNTGAAATAQETTRGGTIPRRNRHDPANAELLVAPSQPTVPSAAHGPEIRSARSRTARAKHPGPEEGRPDGYSKRNKN